MNIFKRFGDSNFLKRDSKDIDEQKTELEAKVFVGNFCGKSALLWAHVLGHKNLDGYHPSTLEFLGRHKHSMALPPYTINLEIQDTPGQEDYARLRPVYYKISDIIVMLFQIGNPDTFDNLEESFQHELTKEQKRKPRLVVGCQLDNRYDPKVIAELLKYSQTPVSRQKGIEMAKKLGAWGYAECSAQDYNGVKEVFDAIGQMVLAIRQQPKKERTMPFFVISPELSQVEAPAARDDSPRSANLVSQDDEYDFVPPPNNLVRSNESDSEPRSNNLVAQESGAWMRNNMVSQDDDELRPRRNNLVA